MKQLYDDYLSPYNLLSNIICLTHHVYKHHKPALLYFKVSAAPNGSRLTDRCDSCKANLTPVLLRVLHSHISRSFVAFFFFCLYPWYVVAKAHQRHLSWWLNVQRVLQRCREQVWLQRDNKNSHVIGTVGRGRFCRPCYTCLLGTLQQRAEAKGACLACCWRRKSIDKARQGDWLLNGTTRWTFRIYFFLFWGMTQEATKNHSLFM